MDNNYTLKDLVLILWRNKRKIIAATLLAGVVATIISLLMPNYYRATTVFYPASTDLSNPQKILRGDDDVKFFGTGDDIERLFSIGESRALADNLINEFNLMERYDIDSTDKKARLKTGREFNSLYEIKRTERDAIELSIEDKDPEFAAEITNYARSYIESQSKEMILVQQRKKLQMLESNLEVQNKEIQLLSDSLEDARTKYSIFNMPAQTEYFSTEIPKTEADLAKTIGEYNVYKENPNRFRDSIIVKQAEVQGLKRKLNILNRDGDGEFGLNSMKKGMPILDKIGAKFYPLMGQYNQTLKVAEEVRNSINSSGNSIIVIEEAIAPQEKSRPVRSLIVIAVMLLTAALAKLFILGRHTWDAEFNQA